MFPLLFWLDHQWVFSFQRNAVLLLALWWQFFGHSKEASGGSCPGRSSQTRKHSPSYAAWSSSLSTLGRSMVEQKRVRSVSTTLQTCNLGQEFEGHDGQGIRTHFSISRPVHFFVNNSGVTLYGWRPWQHKPKHPATNLSLAIMGRWNPVKKPHLTFFLMFSFLPSEMSDNKNTSKKTCSETTFYIFPLLMICCLKVTAQVARTLTYVLHSKSCRQKQHTLYA